MNVKVLAKRAIANIEAGKLEIRPGLSNVLMAMSRIAPPIHAQADGEDGEAQEVTRPPIKGISTSS